MSIEFDVARIRNPLSRKPGFGESKCFPPRRRLSDNSARWMRGGAGALECGSLLPLSLSELARVVPA